MPFPLSQIGICRSALHSGNELEGVISTRYIGVDPGSKFTGIAILEEDGTFSFHGEYDNPVAAWEVIARETDGHQWDYVVILEDMLGSGQRDAHIIRTIKLVGYIYYHCIEAGITVELVPNQARLANIGNVPFDITGKDEIAAAAHALSAKERRKA